ncbi:MAG: extensin family protein [Alphaproteobacteria bacterium]|nr:extensin family protein [Alphaproteobacteria bacterium]MDE2042988.1 extensin family protein [Alphaproteobacteria bacterium]MDE2340925.1 extensin family protein [Alphaproteobacteria bacterium]
MLRRVLLLTILLAVSACVGPPPEAPHRVYHHPVARTKPRAMPTPFALPSMNLAQCEGALTHSGAVYDVLPDQQFSPSCSALGAVQMDDVAPGIPITNTKALTCEAALPLAQWFSGSVQPAAQRWFGEPVVKLESMGTYACRHIIGNAAYSYKISEHARANAVDIGAFILASGRRVSILNGWRGNADESGFLHEVHDAACQHFITVLSPDYNAAHHNHLHFDMGGSHFCR